VGKTAWKAEGLQFIEFLEALARVAELKNLPSAAEIATGTWVGGAPNIVEYQVRTRVDANKAVWVPAAADRPPEHGLAAFLELVARKVGPPPTTPRPHRRAARPPPPAAAAPAATAPPPPPPPTTPPSAAAAATATLSFPLHLHLICVSPETSLETVLGAQVAKVLRLS